LKQSIVSIGAVIPSENGSWRDAIPSSFKRRTPRIWQMSLAAADIAIKNSDKKPTAIVCSTALGALEETLKFMNKLADSGLGSPRQFISSVHNSMAGKIALEFDIKGANLTLCDSHTSVASAVITAALLKDETVLLVFVDEHLELLDAVYKDCINIKNFDANPKEGAVAVVLSKEFVDGSIQILATAPKPASSDGHTLENSFFKPAYDLFTKIKNSDLGEINSYSSTARAVSSVTLSR
jgi:hypothetical protein